MAQPPATIDVLVMSTKFLTGNPSLTIGPCELSTTGSEPGSIATRGLVNDRAPDLAKGQLIVHDPATGTNTALLQGESGQILAANSAADSGLTWAAAAPVTAPELAQGQLIVHSITAGTNTVLPQASANGQILTANNGVDSGLSWAAIPAPATAPELAQGQLIVHSNTAGTNAIFLPGGDGQVLTADDEKSAGFVWAAMPESMTAPELTKGQLIVRSETAGTNTALPQGGNGQVLTANDGETSGLAWAAVPAPATAPELTQGQLIVHSGTAGTNVVFPPAQSNNLCLVPDSSVIPAGLKWAPLPSVSLLIQNIIWLQGDGTFTNFGTLSFCKVGRLVSLFATVPSNVQLVASSLYAILDNAVAPTLSVYYPLYSSQELPMSYNDNGVKGWGALRIQHVQGPSSNSWTMEAKPVPIIHPSVPFSGVGPLSFKCDAVYLSRS